MIVVETYSHKGGDAFIRENHPAELAKVVAAIEGADTVWCLRKISKEKTKPPLLFHPESLNFVIKKFLTNLGWTEPAPKSKKGFREPCIRLGPREFREMDGIKNKVGLDVQFGKYAFMGYDIFSKMPIFAKRGLIECGIEVVAMPAVPRYQISAYAGPGNGGNIHHGCYVVDITTGAVWHMALGQKPEQVAEKLP